MGKDGESLPSYSIAPSPIRQFDGPLSHELTNALELRAPEEVDGKHMIAAVGAALRINGLIHVPHFDAPRTVTLAFETEPNKNAVLVKASALSPIRIVKRHEQLIPDHERAFRAAAKVFLSADKLSESQSDIIGGLQDSLFKACSRGKSVGAKRARRGPLLPDSVLVRVVARNWRRSDPAVAGPQCRIVAEVPPDSRTNDALSESIIIFEQSLVPVEPPSKSRIGRKMILGEDRVPLAHIIDRLGGRGVAECRQDQNRKGNTKQSSRRASDDFPTNRFLVYRLLMKRGPVFLGCAYAIGGGAGGLIAKRDKLCRAGQVGNDQTQAAEFRIRP